MIIRIAKLLPEHGRELVHGERVRYELGLEAQRRVAEANKQIERRYMEGLGALRASFTAEVFNALELQRGRGWWRDKKELGRFLRENPMFAVGAKHRRFSIRVDGLRKVESRKAKVENGGVCNRERPAGGAPENAPLHAAAREARRSLASAERGAGVLGHETTDPLSIPDARKNEQGKEGKR
jgi:hypothetical protein